jgi:tetratricopeptide (TPR) repeat protein
MVFFQRAFTLARSCGDINQQSHALQYIALTEWRLGDYLTAQMHASEAHQLARSSANLYQEAKSLCIDAICSRDLGNHEDAMVLLHRSRECLKRCGMTGGGIDATIIGNKAELHLLKSEYPQAQAIQLQLVRDVSLRDDKYFHAFALMNVAQIDVIIGTPKHEVQHKLTEVKMIFSILQQSTEQRFCDMILAELYLREGDESHAKFVFEQSFHLLFGNQAEHTFYCLERLADPG